MLRGVSGARRSPGAARMTSNYCAGKGEKCRSGILEGAEFGGMVISSKARVPTCVPGSRPRAVVASRVERGAASSWQASDARSCQDFAVQARWDVEAVRELAPLNNPSAVRCVAIVAVGAASSARRRRSLAGRLCTPQQWCGQPPERAASQSGIGTREQPVTADPLCRRRAGVGVSRAAHGPPQLVANGPRVWNCHRR